MTRRQFDWGHMPIVTEVLVRINSWSGWGHEDMETRRQEDKKTRGEEDKRRRRQEEKKTRGEEDKRIWCWHVDMLGKSWVRQVPLAVQLITYISDSSQDDRTIWGHGGKLTRVQDHMIRGSYASISKLRVTYLLTRVKSRDASTSKHCQRHNGPRV